MSSKPIEIQLARALSEFSEEENKRIEKNMKKAALSCKHELQETSPHESNEYARGWAIKKKRTSAEMTYRIYNRAKPGLTHLLEHGHDTKNQYGSYPERRTPAHKHISTAADNAEELFIDLMVRDL